MKGKFDDRDVAEGGALVVLAEPSGKNKHKVRFEMDGDLIHTDTINLHDAKARQRLCGAVARKTADQFRVEFAPSDIEAQLLKALDQQEQAARQACEAAQELGERYEIVTDADDLDQNGIYYNGKRGPIQLTNFALQIEREVRVDDEVQPTIRFEGTLLLHDRRRPIRLTAGEFADSGKLKAAIFEAGGVAARFLAPMPNWTVTVSTIALI